MIDNLIWYIGAVTSLLLMFGGVALLIAILLDISEKIIEWFLLRFAIKKLFLVFVRDHYRKKAMERNNRAENE